MTQEYPMIIWESQEENISVDRDTNKHTDNNRYNSHDLYYSYGIIDISTTLPNIFQIKGN